MPDIVMPRLSDSMEEGTILKWLKAEGEAVSRGEPLAEIETDKATLTYEADADGVLAIVAPAGETLPIGSVIARLGQAGSAGEPEPESGDTATAAPDSPAAPDSAPDGTAAPETETTGPAAPDSAPDGTAAPETEPTGPAASDADGATPAAPPAQAASDKANGRVKASPLARRIARDEGIDLQQLDGSGPGGRIVKADVEQATRSGTAQRAPEAPSPAEPEPAEPAESVRSESVRSEPVPSEPVPSEPAPSAPAAAAQPTETGTAKGDVTVQELTRTQRLIARRMAESKATVPEFTLRSEIDMEACVQLRTELKALGGEAPIPSYNDMVVKAGAVALREFPRANAAYRDGRFELYSRVNVGVAVAAHDALVVATVFDADMKPLREIARETRALAERVRSQTITPPEVSGGTFTVSNLGMYGVSDFTAVINSPQAAILAVGALAQRAVVRDGEIVARHTMGVTLACDHRILYGADAAEFLARIRALLEQPLALVY